MRRSNEWNALASQEQELILGHQQDFPIKIGAIAKDLGVIVKRSTLKPGISGEIREVDGGVIVKINRHDSKERQRFTLAHEIAHFLLHKDDIKNGIEDTVLFRSSLSNEKEAEANRLAADLVMPFSLIENIKFPPGTRREIVVEQIAKIAELSTPAIDIRLGKKGF